MKYRFEIRASLGFVVEAPDPRTAAQQAEQICQEILNDHALNFPPELDIYLALEDSPPDFIEELKE